MGWRVVRDRPSEGMVLQDQTIRGSDRQDAAARGATGRLIAVASLPAEQIEKAAAHLEVMKTSSMIFPMRWSRNQWRLALSGCLTI